MSQTKPPLADGPLQEELTVYHNSEWSRTFAFHDRNTREVVDLTNISFYGSVGLDGTTIASFIFEKVSDNKELSIKLPVAIINDLDTGKVYDYDWFMVENGVPEVFNRSRLVKKATVTSIP